MNKYKAFALQTLLPVAAITLWTHASLAGGYYGPRNTIPGAGVLVASASACSTTLRQTAGPRPRYEVVLKDPACRTLSRAQSAVTVGPRNTIRFGGAV